MLLGTQIICMSSTELTKLNLPTESKQYLLEKRELSDNFVKEVRWLFKNIIKNEDKVKFHIRRLAKLRLLRIKQEDLFDRLVDRWRWPETLLDGTPSLQIRKSNGKIVKPHMEKDGYINSFNNIVAWESGEELIVRRAHTMFKNTLYAKNLFSKLLNRKNVYFDGFFRSGHQEIKSIEHKFRHHIVIKNCFGYLKVRLNGKINPLKPESAVWVEKGTKIQIFGIKYPTYYLYYHL